MSSVQPVHELLSPKHEPHSSWSLFASWSVLPPEQTPQSSTNASPKQSPLQSWSALPPLHIPQSSYSPTQSSILSHTKSPSASSHGRSTQSPVLKLSAWPSVLDTTRPDKQASKSVARIERLVSTPVPAGTKAPLSENPII